MVSKQWHNLILDPYFAISHLSYAAAASPGFLLQSQTLIYGSNKLGYKLGFIHLQRGGKIVMRDLGIDLPEPIIASCNGLVLFENYPKEGDFCVGNLFSRKGKLLRLQDYNNNSYLYKVLGFTYVKETGEYKIVCLMCKEDDSYCVMIFTLGGSNTWTQVKQPGRHFWEEFRTYDIADRWEEFLFDRDEEEDVAARWPATAVCVNNFLHWLFFSKDFKRVVFTIDSNNGICHMNDLPFEYDHTRTGELTKLGGVLALTNYWTLTLIKIWVLKDSYKKEWIQLHSLQMEAIPPVIGSSFLLGDLGNGEVLLYANCKDEWSYNSCYALDVQSRKVIKTFPFALPDRHFCLQHVNSLISIKSL